MILSDVLTFLFTDIEGSTQMWERDPEAMDAAVAQHFDVLGSAVEAQGGTVVKRTGDGIFATFKLPINGVHAAARAQRELVAATWPLEEPVRVRMGLHAGPCTTRDGDHYGRAVNKAARIEQAAYGGQVLLTDGVAELVVDALDDGLSLASLGAHHFDGITEPELVYQLVVPGMPETYPPLRTRDVGLVRLPPELTPLTGRSGEAALVGRELQEHRTVTLLGPPGVGKSRLALRVATELGRQRSSGVRFIDLTACRQVEATAATVATALGVQPDHEDEFVPAILRALRSSDALVVLDNCEHLLDGVVPLVDTIVAECPGVSVLATSRERLGAAAERVRGVAPLDLPLAGDPTTAIAASPSIELLLERARAVDPTFELTDANAGVLAEIARRCDGLPLALELAAARLASLSAEELLADLHGSIAVLDRGASSGAGRRHAGLSEALDVSYGSLPVAEQVLFDRLAAFVGVVTTEVVAAVCELPAEPCREQLERLVARSLLVADRDGTSSRYRMLESVRQYALDHGRVDQDLRRRHAEYFVAEAEARGDQYRTSEAILAARAMVDAFDDFRLAFQQLVADGTWVDAARLVLALHPFCTFSMRTELQTWAAEIDGHLPEDDPHCAEVRAVRALGAWFRGDHQRALDHGRAALDAAERAEQAGHPACTIWAHTAMLNAAGFTGDFAAALQHLRSLRAECRATQDPWWMVNALATEAVANASVGMHEHALLPAARAVHLAEELANPECRYWAAYAQALVLRPDDLEAAQASLVRALAAARSNGSRFNEGIVLMEQLSVHIELGDLTTAAITALDLIGHLERAGGHGQIWQAVLLSARVLADAGRDADSALLLFAVADRPRLPATGTDALIADLEARLVRGAGHVDLDRLHRRARFLTDGDIIGLASRALEELLRT